MILYGTKVGVVHDPEMGKHESMPLEGPILMHLLMINELLTFIPVVVTHNDHLKEELIILDFT